MDSDFRGWLQSVLDDKEKLNMKPEQEGIITEYLNGSERGVCFGCHTELRKTVGPEGVKILHVLYDPVPTCEYGRGHDSIPEWAFFPTEMLGGDDE